MLDTGRIFFGYFTSADASALTEGNSRLTLYDTNRSAITLAANERVVIDQIDVIVGGSGLTVTLYDGADATPAAGEIFFLGTLAANGYVSQSLMTPQYGKNNNSLVTPLGYPKVKTSGAGQVDVIVRGVIEKLGQ